MLIMTMLSCSEPPAEMLDHGRIVTSVQSVWKSVVDLPLNDPDVVFDSDVTAGVELISIRAAASLPDGGVALLDRRLLQVIVYDGEGEVRRILGGQGEGPGEFLAPSTLTVLPDGTVVVYDRRTRRLTSFPLITDDPALVALPPDVFDRAPIAMWPREDGTWLSFEGDIRSSEVIVKGGEVDLVGPQALVRRGDFVGGAVDTIHSGTVGSENIRIGNTFLTPAFGRSTLVGVSGEMVAIALPTGFEVRVLDADGAWLTALMPDAEVPLRRSEIVRLRDSVRAASADAGQGFMAEPMFTPELQPSLRPSFSDIVVGPDGRVLLREFAPPGRRAATWWVLDPSGTFQGRVRLPADASILEIGPGHLLALRLDAFDVPMVEMHRVEWSDLGPG